MKQEVPLPFRSGRAPLPDHDETAIAALGFIAADSERLDRFVALSGIDPGSLRTAAATPGFLDSVFDYLLSDEPLLLAFAAEQNLRPETLLLVHQKRHAPRAGYE